MKKKSPPYAIIGAVVLGIVAILIFFKHERDVATERDAAIAKAKADADAAIANANKQTTATVTPTALDVRPVLYATQPIEPGIRISSAFYEKKQTPKDILPDAYTESSDIVGWFATRKIEKGDPLTPRNIGKSLPYMSQRITPGMRAVSLSVFNVEPENRTGGYAVDGDKVDLLFTTTTTTNIALNTQMVMQNVPILSITGSPVKTEKTDGVNPVYPPGDPMAVTFEVTPEQAQALIYLSTISKNGHFSMILRARKDDTQIKIKPFDMDDYNFLKMTKVQKTVDKSIERVKALSKEIEDKEKAQAAQGSTNETTTPTPTAP